jgi:hypothetical protein
MDNENKFPEQHAPEKNTDNAYVRVGENGEPEMPSSDNKKSDIEKEDHVTTLDKR